MTGISLQSTSKIWIFCVNIFAYIPLIMYVMQEINYRPSKPILPTRHVNKPSKVSHMLHLLYKVIKQNRTIEIHASTYHCKLLIMLWAWIYFIVFAWIWQFIVSCFCFFVKSPTTFGMTIDTMTLQVTRHRKFIYPQEISPVAWRWTSAIVTLQGRLTSNWLPPNSAPSMSPWLALVYTAVQLEVLPCQPFPTTGTRFGVNRWLAHMKTALSHATTSVNVQMFAAMWKRTSVIRSQCPCVKLVAEICRTLC